jgi:hypothetical protein
MPRPTTIRLKAADRSKLEAVVANRTIDPTVARPRVLTADARAATWFNTT